jgi:hypothetical protein
MTFKLPDPITPRPGERIVAYQGVSKYIAVFDGYNIHDGLMVKTCNDHSMVIDNYLKLRPEDPFNRKNPCWTEFIGEKKVRKANKREKDAFNVLLSKVIPPGPSYIDFISEIWHRGYEIFLVGGSVRDVINGQRPKDVDLVTSIPFHLLTPLVESMFGQNGHSRKRENGFMSVGVNAGDYENRSIYDPLIDVKNFFAFAPGTENAIFSADIRFDHKIRDFACNAIYYDPINCFFVDPSGLGLNHAEHMQLNLINDVKIEHPEYKKADISFRYFKFIRRGYVPTDACIIDMSEKIMPIFPSIGHTFSIVLFQKYFLKGQQKALYDDIIMEIKELMLKYGYKEIWNEYYDPHYGELKDVD